MPSTSQHEPRATTLRSIGGSMRSRRSVVSPAYKTLNLLMVGSMLFAQQPGPNVKGAKSAEAVNPAEIYALALQAETGDGRPRDLKEAADLYARAASLGVCSISNPSWIFVPDGRWCPARLVHGNRVIQAGSGGSRYRRSVPLGCCVSEWNRHAQRSLVSAGMAWQGRTSWSSAGPTDARADVSARTGWSAKRIYRAALGPASCLWSGQAIAQKAAALRDQLDKKLLDSSALSSEAMAAITLLIGFGLIALLSDSNPNVTTSGSYDPHKYDDDAGLRRMRQRSRCLSEVNQTAKTNSEELAGRNACMSATIY